MESEIILEHNCNNLAGSLVEQTPAAEDEYETRCWFLGRKLLLIQSANIHGSRIHVFGSMVALCPLPDTVAAPSTVPALNLLTATALCY